MTAIETVAADLATPAEGGSVLLTLQTGLKLYAEKVATVLYPALKTRM
jgi:hypothetical protein